MPRVASAEHGGGRQSPALLGGDKEGVRDSTFSYYLFTFQIDALFILGKLPLSCVASLMNIFQFIQPLGYAS